MMRVVASLVLTKFMLPSSAEAARLDPSTVRFPWINADAPDLEYALADYPNVVHVFEAFTVSCGGCSSNAPNVQALAREFAGEPRVQVLDLGQDSDARDYMRWIQRHRPEYPVVKDVDQGVFKVLDRFGTVPQTFIVDCTGLLIDAIHGVWDRARAANVRRAIGKALQAHCE